MASRPDGRAERPSASEFADAFSRACKVLSRKFDEQIGEGGVLPHARASWSRLPAVVRCASLMSPRPSASRRV